MRCRCGVSPARGPIRTCPRRGWRRPPGYPLLLAPGAALNHPIAFALALQILLSVGTTHLVYSSAARLFNERAGTWAALLCAVEPVMLVWTATIMAETLFTCLVAGMVYALICYRDRPAFLPAAAAGVLSAGAGLTKPIAFARGRSLLGERDRRR